MKSFLQKLFTAESQQLDLLIIEMKGLRKNRDFEVISKSCVDSQGNEFVSFEEFNDFWAYQSILKDIPAEKFTDFMIQSNVKLLESDDLFDADRAYLYGDKVDMDNAKRCNFGTIRFLDGKFKNQSFMYPLTEFDLDLQLFAYGVLTYGFCDRRMMKHITDEKNHKYCKMVLGQDTFDQVLQRIRTR